MTLSFSGLKDGDEAESLELSNLDDFGDSEEDDVQPETVEYYNEYSFKEGNQHFRGSRRRGLVVTVNTLMQNHRRLQEWICPS